MSGKVTPTGVKSQYLDHNRYDFAFSVDIKLNVGRDI